MKDQHDKFAVLADDLTGALDCAAAFLSSGFTPFVSITSKVPEDADFDLLSLNMDTRRIRIDDAKIVISESVDQVRDVGAQPIYVKIDSTLRGHPGIEISEIAKMSGSGRTFISPAFPATDRIVQNGELSLGGVPLALTEVGRDPLSPATSSNVAELLLAHSSIPIVEAHLAEIRSGKLVERADGNAEDSPLLISCDAETDRDLGQIAKAGLKSASPLFAGSAGLAGALSEEIDAPSARNSSKDVRLTDGPILLVTASQRSLADRQIEHASADFGIEIIPVEFIAGKCSNISDVKFDHDSAIQMMSDGANLAIRASIRGDVDSLQPPQIRELADRVTDQLSQLIVDLCGVRKPSAVVLIGGDTAFASLTAAGADGIFLLSQPQPGVPVGTISGGMLDGAFIATKAGAFGDEQTVSNLLKYLLENRTLS